MFQTIVPDRISIILGESKEAWERFITYTRKNYEMEELWYEGKPESNYRNELKFRRGGKTLVTLYVREGFFKVNIIFGKAERAKFESRIEEFPEVVKQVYTETKTYHDGKWLLFDVKNSEFVDDLCRLLTLKRKPNRKEF